MSLEFRRHYKLLVLFALVLAVLVLGLGRNRIIAYTVPGSMQVMEQSINYGGDVALFDDTVVHSIQILISDADYEQMITTYRETGLKDYFHADVIIDGVRVNNVGVRLKGNASLRTALGGRGQGMGGRGLRVPGDDNLRPFDPENMPDFREMLPFDPENMPEIPGMPPFDPENMPDMPNFEGGEWPALPEGQMPNWEGMPFQPGDGTSPDEQGTASKTPLMIKFNEFLPGQTYQGYKNLAIRTYGISVDAAMLQEPITFSTFRLLGQPAPRTAYVGLRINDGAEQLYNISEVINDDYVAQHFDNANGVLYKAEIGSTLTYQGDDPSLYARDFTQQTRVNDADMAPLIAFMRFLSESDDESFERDLPAYLDVDAFATYLAINNLLVNTDSIIGMNNNYYVYYDDVSERFTLLMWDGNESLGKLAGGSRAAEYDLYTIGQGMGRFPGGDRRGAGGEGRGPGGGTNILLQRFMANPTFKALYESKLREVYQQAFVSGAITQLVEQYVSPLRQANEERNLVALEQYEQAVANVLDFVAQRSAYLASTSLLADLASAPND